MTQRYFVDHPITSDTVRLTGAEAHHLLHVMRCRPGQTAVLFDDSGREFGAEVAEIGRDWVVLQVRSTSVRDRELACEILVGSPLPKGDRQRFLVEKLVELGARAFVPIFTARSMTRVSAQGIARLERYAIEASKQCGRNRLMRIGPAVNCEAFFSSVDGSCKWVGHPGGQPLSRIQSSATIAIAVGPEGGFTTDEIDVAKGHGWQCVDLGPRTLRTETAAIAMAAIAGLDRC